jgi:negative regulator of flagellin synthesis FlgM
MADKISNQSRGNVDITQSRSRAVDPAHRAGKSSTAKQAEAPRDDVELTNTATNLRRIEAKLASIPETDQARVDDVRQRIEAGSYEVDHERIAQKLLRIDQDLT